jgi:hypothetical protein
LSRSRNGLAVPSILTMMLAVRRANVIKTATVSKTEASDRMYSSM